MARSPNAFYKLSALITAGDLMWKCGGPVSPDEPFTTLMDEACESPHAVNDVWLVGTGNRILGYCFAIDDSDDTDPCDLAVSDVMEPLLAIEMVSADMSYFDLAALFAENPHRRFFVLADNEIVGWVPFAALFERVGQMCLLSLCLHLEWLAEAICLITPARYFETLPPKRKEKAEEELRKNPRFARARQHNELLSRTTPATLIRATTFIDKGTMLAKSGDLAPWSAKGIRDVFATAERVRNTCAHIGSADDFVSFRGVFTPAKKDRFTFFLSRTQDLVESMHLLYVRMTDT
jgi:hypothetical protein